MKLERIKCKHFERAKDFCISKSYIIGCTGRKAAILDKNLNHIHTVENLDYVYSAQMSPDETKLLLISNGNKFYLVDMQTFEINRVTVRAPYNYNLEGRGCWSFDGKFIWIPVNNATGYVNSTLRRYCVDDLKQYEDYLTEKYHLDCISRIEQNETFFLTGYNRKENNKRYFIYFDGANFREIPAESASNTIVYSAAVDMEKGIVTLSTIAGCLQFTLEGKKIRSVSHPYPKEKTFCFSDGFLHLLEGYPEKQKALKETSAALGLDKIAVSDDVIKFVASSCGRYMYMASQSGLYLLDANTGDILAFHPEEFGVQNVAELTPGVIIISTWSGVKFYKFNSE